MDKSINNLVLAGNVLCAAMEPNSLIDPDLAVNAWEVAVKAVRDKKAAGEAQQGQPCEPLTVKRFSAPDILIEAADCIESRASQRDKPGGERSMRAAMATFNALTGRDLTEREGWVFMAILKLARAQGGKHTRDDYVDGAAYVALACEAAEQETA